MPNLTLKDVPPALHARLRARAEQHHRSLNREAIACLEAAVLAERVDVKELLAKAAAARRRVRSGFSSSTIRRLIRTGRP
jgi:plasmid stability protein